MSDEAAVRDRLRGILEALERIPSRTSEIDTAADFRANDANLEHLDSVCMILLAVGEAFKQVDRATNGTLPADYPDIDWAGVKGVRDDIPRPTAAVRQLLENYAMH